MTGRLRVELHALAVAAGYWIRPYDHTLDARRWRWQTRGRCGRQMWLEMTDEDRAALEAAVRATLTRRADAAYPKSEVRDD